MATLYLSLGTNLGDRRSNLETAISLIGRRIGTVQAQSSVFETQPWGFESKNLFLNMAIKVQTGLEPLEVLHTAQAIEKEMGRTAKTGPEGYKDRIIDIDILLYDDLVIDSPELTIPHPHMYQRPFVMEPLAQIAPELTNI
ncbi:MAG: 2-amino-4-hydroxy-6-hydroxymethyldihydropteridine diphosphokinase [Bacteroidaceae bacterium]|nr:2-amino-4-hydroxy-6-hydroxymethyldihydropteridine diphosphokinase [Bacteroidaceae bacterium]